MTFLFVGVGYAFSAVAFYVNLARKAPLMDEPALTLVEGSAPQAEVVELFPTAEQKAA